MQWSEDLDKDVCEKAGGMMPGSRKAKSPRTGFYIFTN